MSRLLDDDQDELPERDRELTLSTGAILAIFLGLVLSMRCLLWLRLQPRPQVDDRSQRAVARSDE